MRPGALAIVRREQRLTRSADYAAVAREGRSVTSRLLVLRARRYAGGGTRFGIAVSKAVGGAVVRNRVKRRLREILRGQPVSPGWDIVFSARRPAATATFQQLQREARSLIGRARLHPVEGTAP